MTLFSTINRWRALPTAILPLSFLQALSTGFIELPVVYLFRDIECEAYSYVAPPHIPEIDICKWTPVQKAYATDVAIFFGIITVLSIIVSGPFGRISDNKGRKAAMLGAAVLNAAGDLWLSLTALSHTFRSSYWIYFAAILKGCGGGFSVAIAAHSAFVADTSSTARRSYFLGLALVLFWIASAISPLIGSALLSQDLYGTCFLAAAGCWAVYILYALVILRETRIPVARIEPSHPEIDSSEVEPVGGIKRSLEKMVPAIQAIVEPITVIFNHPTLSWVGIAAFSMLVASGTFAILIPYCDLRFGLSGSEASVIAAILATCRAFAILIILPIFLSIYRRIFAPKKSSQPKPAAPPSENTPLLQEEITTESSEQVTPSGGIEDKEQKVSASQELAICRLCFIIDALGLILITFARDYDEITAAAAFGSLGSPATPSLQALVTLASTPQEFGRVLAGFAVIDSAAIALRTPILFGIYVATLSVAPSVVWWFGAALFILSAVIMMSLRPTRFAPKSEQEPVAPPNHEEVEESLQ